MQTDKWQILKREPIVEHPFLRVSMEQVSLPSGEIIDDWPIVHARDYVNVVAFNENGEALILKGYKHGARRNSWQVVGGYLEPGEDPLEAAQRELREEIGLVSDEWYYLGSFIIDANRHVGTGHFFLCQNAWQGTAPSSQDLESFELSWVSLKELRYALSDGRISIISYAANILLALLALEKLGNNQALPSFRSKTNGSNPG